jgi:HK97 family phage major capsid protein
MKYLEILRAKLEALTEQRAAAVNDMEAATATATEESRSALNDTETAAFEEARSRVESIDAEIAEIEPRIAELAEIDSRAREVGKKVLNVVLPHDVEPILDGRALVRTPAGELRDRAMRILEGEDSRGVAGLSSDQKDKVDSLLRRSSTRDFDSNHIALRMVTTENDAYHSAFVKSIEAGMSGRSAAYTPEEAAAMRTFDEARAMAGQVDTAGGYGVPVLIDPTIILTSQGHTAVVLQDCTHKTITTDTWKGVTSAGMSWSYDSEGSEVSDDTPTLAQPSIPVWLQRGFLPYSVEVGDDYPGLAQELGMLLAESYADAAAYYSAIGTGSSQPKGWQVALDADTNVEVVVTTDGGFAGQDVSKAWSALPERFRGNAVWYMHSNVGEAIAAFSTSTNLAWFTGDLRDPAVPSLRQRPVKFSDYFQSFVSGSTGALNILSVGDPRGYIWVTRTGMSVEAVPHLFGTSNPGRPTTQRGLLAYARNGADFSATNHARLLQNQ